MSLDTPDRAGQAMLHTQPAFAGAAEKAPGGRPALQEPLERIAATLPGVIFSYRLMPDGGSSVPYASGALEELCGIRPEDLGEDTAAIRASVHPDDEARIRVQLQESARSLSPWRGEFRWRHPVKG